MSTGSTLGIALTRHEAIWSRGSDVGPAASSHSAETIATRLVGRVPVRNLWLLMLYASELFRHLGEASISTLEDSGSVADLVAEILAHSVEHRLRTQLSRGYEREIAELGRIRGGIDFLASVRRHTLARGRAVCRFEELTFNTPRNRLVGAALAAIARLVERRDLSHRCASLERVLVRLGVARRGSTRELLSVVQLAPHERSDRLMVAAARLALQLRLPTEEVGPHRLLRPDQDEAWVRNLFERAVGGLYRTVLRAPEWRVRQANVIRWPVEVRSQLLEALLPTMKLDVVVDHVATNERLIIDTKFTSIVTSGRFRMETLSSGYMFQLYAYVRSQEASDALGPHAAGMLLHPSVDRELDEWAVIQGHEFRFATVDLTRSPREIRARLRSLVTAPPGK